jgi:hypothetical protein
VSDEQAETWRVIEESGEERIVEVTHITDRSFPYWQAWCHSDRRGGMLSQNSARHAVLELAANHKWNAVEVLAPGQASRVQVERERDEALASSIAATRRAHAIRDVVAKVLEDRASQHGRRGDRVVEFALSDAAAEVRALNVPEAPNTVER